ncbi:MAG: SGNH/GDSL hydrolase family protein [Deltaproteobacteria bacterium]|nr:SGNH/GDSL hydrolase family protein [Deltaproteobacteria bacterium]
MKKFTADADNLFRVQMNRGKQGQIPNLPEDIPEPEIAGVYVGRGRLTSIAMRYFDLAWLIENGSTSNKAVPKPSQADAGTVILAFGDSITQGLGDTPSIVEPGNGRRTGGYEPKLESLMPNCVVYNWGLAGENTQQGLNRLQLEVLTNPADYILMLEGTNDRSQLNDPALTELNLGLMIDQCWAKGVTPILSTLTPDTNPFGNYEGYDVSIRINYNPRIRDLATTRGVILADQYNGLRYGDPGWLSWTDDGLHPNNPGYYAMADIWFQALTTIPTVETTGVSAITATSASSGGDVTSDGGASVTARGVCWSTSANPTVSNDKTTDGTGTGSFTSAITGLSPLTTYHVRAYATNSVGTAYGSDVSFESTCSGGAIVIQNKTFEGGTTTVCECTESITIGPGVTIKSNADVTFKAPFVNGVAGLTIEEGARVRIYP